MESNLSFQNLDPVACHGLIQDEGYCYVDVRTPDEFSSGHAAGSTNVPYALIGPGGMMPNPQFLAVMMRLHSDTSTPLVLGCASGGRSAKACMMLAASGYSRLVNVRTGFGGHRDDSGVMLDPGWAHCGLPVEAGSTAGSYDAVRASLSNSPE